MNRQQLLGILAFVALLVFLLGYEKSMLHYSKIIGASQCFIPYQGKVPSENPEMTPPAIVLLPLHKRFLQFRATRWINDKAFHRYLTSPDNKCNKSYRAGHRGDGGWDVCISGPYLPKPPCLVYSFGINNDFSFDDAIVRRFNCNVFAFDPSMKVESHKRGKNIDFIKEGISGRNFKDKHGWNLYSFATILKEQNHQNSTIDYFKMDIERSEWQVIPDMAVRGLFKNIKQIGLEIHRIKKDTQSAQLINILEDNNFRKWKMHYNMNCGYKMRDGTKTSKCIELYFINLDFIESSSIGQFTPS